MASAGLKGQTALVTGAGRRLGRAIAHALAAQGMNIVAHYSQSAAEAEALCGELTALGVRAWPLAADFADETAVAALLPRALAAAGRLDALVNNASIFLPGALENITFPDLVNHFRINAWTPLALSRDFARLVGRGKIVNLLDTRIDGTDRAHVAYLLSKQALASLTRLTASEFAPAIAVNGVAPGLILPPPGRDDAYLDRLAQATPLQRHGEPADIAAAVVFLLQSDFITGEVLRVDGGRHLREGGRGPDPH
jgi:NAD(P)-dependent dehydrogenase (short-subunit alcohol dehydrogenase family)